MDKVIKTEVLLNFLNTVLGKAVYYKDEQFVLILTDLREDFYRGRKEYDLVLSEVNSLDRDMTIRYA